MEPIILQEISFTPDLPRLQGSLRLKQDHLLARVAELANTAEALARPKAAYRPAFISERDDHSVSIEGIRFESRVLAINLQNVHRVFLYLATCGQELDAWAHSLSDPLDRFWAEEIKLQALRAALQHLIARIERDYRPGKMSAMSPGSLADWPLPQQRPLFALMHPAAEALGVTLSNSYLMTPNKSASGIRFPTEIGFESCQLCEMPNCPGRRAPYDAEQQRKYMR